MSVLANSNVIGSGTSGGIDTGDIEHSLRFRGAQYIATTLTTAATSTYFILFKQAKLGAINPLFDTNIKINANDTITAFGLTTTAVKRDPIGWHWMHVSNNGLVVDGVNLGAVTTSALTNPRIGYDGTNYANMYGARVCCVSGSSLAYTDFVTFNTTTNEWVVKTKSAIKALVDAGGSAGFMYDFEDATSLTTLGNDYSSKNNDGTLTGGFSLTAGTTYDHMLDVPGNSYCTASPIDLGANPGSSSLTEANLKSACSAVSGGSSTCGTQALPAGKWYWEYVPTTIGDGLILGITSRTSGTPSGTAVGYVFNGQKNIAGTGSAYGAAYAANDVLGVAVDTEANTVTFYKNNASQGVITNATYLVPGCKPLHWNNSSGAGSTVNHNYGQAPLHASATYDSAAGGYFRYAPPTGYKALCQANLPDVAIKNPKLHFDIKTRTGTAATYSVTGLGFQPDLLWSKSRGRAVDHALYDSVRGVQKQLESNSTGAETTETTGLTAFNSDGYTGGALDQINGTTATNSFVDWLWKAGGAAVTNNVGSVSAQVSANTVAGFSIATFASPASGNFTIGHGLPKAPTLVIAKARDGNTYNWAVFHASVCDNGKFLRLNTTDVLQTPGNVWGTAVPSSTLIGLTSTGAVEPSKNCVVFSFTDIEGYSKIGSYTGAASATGDGPCVNLGFKPKFLMGKRTDVAGPWWIVDGAREPSNRAYLELQPNSAYIENNVTDQDPGQFDFTSNGFKVRTLSGDTNAAYTNATGGTYIFIAFADVAGKYSLGR